MALKRIKGFSYQREQLPQDAADFDDWKVHPGSGGGSHWFIFTIFPWLTAIQKRKNKPDHSSACLACLVVMGAHIEAICSGPSLSKHTQKDDVKKGVLQLWERATWGEPEDPAEQPTDSAALLQLRLIKAWWWHGYFEVDFPRQSASWFEHLCFVLW